MIKIIDKYRKIIGFKDLAYFGETLTKSDATKSNYNKQIYRINRKQLNICLMNVKNN